jgi:hypothetical protein
LFRLNSDGSFDPTFQMPSRLPVSKIITLADGTILLLAGSIIRAMPDGSADPSFHTVFFSGSTGPADFDVQPDGKIVVVGSFSTAGGFTRANFARFDAAGNFDPFFAREPPGFGALNHVRAQSDGSLVIDDGIYVAKLTRDGALDNTFPPVRPPQGLRGMAVDDSDRIYFNDGDSLAVYSGRLRIHVPAADIPIVFEQTSAVGGIWMAITAIPANTPWDYLLPNFPGPGNDFFRVRPAQ